jgi:hypothetical protein
MNDVARTAQPVCPSPPRGCFCGDAGEDVIKKDMPTKIAPRCEWSCSSLAFREFNSTADGYATKRSSSHKLHSEEQKPNKAKNQRSKANPNRQDCYQDRWATLSLGSS